MCSTTIFLKFCEAKQYFLDLGSGVAKAKTDFLPQNQFPWMMLEDPWYQGQGGQGQMKQMKMKVGFFKESLQPGTTRGQGRA